MDEAGLHAAVGLPADRTLEDDRVGLVRMVVAVSRADGPPGGGRQPRHGKQMFDLVGLAGHAEGELCVGEGVGEDDLGAEKLFIGGSGVRPAHLHGAALGAEVEEVLEVVLVEVAVELALPGQVDLLDVVVDQELLAALDHVLEETEVLGPNHQQDLGAVVRLVLGHVEGHRVPDQQLEVSLDQLVGLRVVGALDRLLAHLVDADRIADGLAVANEFLVVRLVEVLELVEKLELLNHVAQDLPTL